MCIRDRFNSDLRISFFPNPASNSIFINFPNENKQISIKTFNSFGERVNLDLQKNSYNDISQLPSGMYISEVTTELVTILEKWIKL